MTFGSNFKDRLKQYQEQGSIAPKLEAAVQGAVDTAVDTLVYRAMIVVRLVMPGRRRTPPTSN